MPTQRRCKIANLLQETLEVLKNINKTTDDIKWIGSKDGEYYCSWRDFEQLADKEYNCLYGVEGVAYDLVIVFNDGTYLEREINEHDGFYSEWWKYNEHPILKSDPKPLKELIYRNAQWCSLKDLNE